MPYFIFQLKKVYRLDETLRIQIRVWINNNIYYGVFKYRTTCDQLDQYEFVESSVESLSEKFQVLNYLLPKIQPIGIGVSIEEWTQTFIIRSFFPRKKNLKLHLSCTPKNGRQYKGMSRREVKNKLGEMKNNADTKKFLTENGCPVCLSNFQEILQEKHHIVVLGCGHPICCRCGDKILVSRVPKCPHCRRKMNPQSMEQLNFNNLQKKLYL